MLMRLKASEANTETDIHEHLMTLLFGEPKLPDAEGVLNEEWYGTIKIDR